VDAASARLGVASLEDLFLVPDEAGVRVGTDGLVVGLGVLPDSGHLVRVSVRERRDGLFRWHGGSRERLSLPGGDVLVVRITELVGGVVAVVLLERDAEALESLVVHRLLLLAHGAP
jgi:hypothetical protein